MTSSNAEASRYARQSVLAEIGAVGQQRLAESRVLIVGCGALGSMQAELLARSGVGELRLVDRDVVELHNLQRQTLFDERDAEAGLPKATAAAERLRYINSAVRVEAMVLDVTHSNIIELLDGADVVLDGTDNFETRLLINDACVSSGTPWVYGGVVGVTGTTMAVRPGAGPCLRCLVAEAPPPGLLPTCDTRGVMNTAVAWVAAQQVTEAFKILTRAEVSFPLRCVDAWQGTVQVARPGVNRDCACCVQRRFEYLEGARAQTTTVLCGRDTVQVSPSRRHDLDLAKIREDLQVVGPTRGNDQVIELSLAAHRILLFRDGRAFVHGTSDPSTARSLVARYFSL